MENTEIDTKYELHMNDNLRVCLRRIRCIRTMPSSILQNGETASETAFRYMRACNYRRNKKKRSRMMKQRVQKEIKTK